MILQIHMICDPSLSTDDPLIQSAVEQAKFKYFAITSEASKNMASFHSKLCKVYNEIMKIIGIISRLVNT